MKREVFALRAAIVNTLIEKQFDGLKSKFADKVGVAPTTVTRWFMTGKGHKNIGEDMARKIEKQCGLPPGFMVSPDSRVEVAPREKRLLLAFRDSNPDTQATIERALGLDAFVNDTSATGMQRSLDRPPKKFT